MYQRTPPQPPPSVPPTEEIVPTAQRHNAEKRKLIDAITNAVDPAGACFENVVRPLADLENRHSDKEAVIYALRYAAPERATQHAVEEAEKLWRELGAEIDGRTDYYALLKAVKDRGESLDYESEKFLDRKLLAYTQCGHGSLGKADIQRWLDTNNKVQDLCTEFNRNMREYDGGIWLTVEELDGVPKYELDHFQVGTDGKLFVSLKGRDGFTVVKYARHSDTRMRVQAADCVKLSENVPIFKQAIHLRDENARLLGCKSHAAYKLPYRLAESTEWIDDLLRKLGEGLIPYGQRDLELLEEKKRSHLAASAADQSTGPTEAKVLPWDVAYYRRLMEEDAAVDHDKIAEYFPLRHTVGIMLQFFADYLQLRFDLISSEEMVGSVWAEEVEAWSVWDERPEAKNAFVGYLYADLLERPNKYRHNQCVNIQPGYIREDGSRVYPATILMCYFPRPTSTALPCLKHRDVVTLFHELGHGMHDLLARTKYEKFHGYAVCLEFGEAIGMMLENWCWMPDQLKAMSLHYTRVDPTYLEAWQRANEGSPLPPETIPDELLENLIRRRPVDRLQSYLRQLSDSSFDMAVHNPPSHEDLVSLNETELYKDLCEYFECWRHPEPSHLHVRLGHLMAGYDAGYYSYLWLVRETDDSSANVLAVEFFQKNFAKDPRSRVAWDRFRRGILLYGGSRNEREVLEDFLGHPASPDALLRGLGLPPIS